MKPRNFGNLKPTIYTVTMLMSSFVDILVATTKHLITIVLVSSAAVIILVVAVIVISVFTVRR